MNGSTVMKSGINQLDSSDIARITRACVQVTVKESENIIVKREPSVDLYIVTSSSFNI